MTTVKEQIDGMLSAIANKDYDTANDLFHSVISQKVSDRLDVHKVEVGAKYFNGFKEGDIDGVDEGFEVEKASRQ